MVPSKMDSPIWGMTTAVPADARADGTGVGWGVLCSGTEAGGVGAGLDFADAAGADSFGLDLAAAGAGAGGCAVAPVSDTTATTVLISTVAPSGTLISLSTPATGEGISASTLSVEISNSGSSFCTVSPVFLSHLVMVPSKIGSPIWGMTTSVGMNRFLRNAGRQGARCSSRIINRGAGLNAAGGAEH